MKDRRPLWLPMAYQIRAFGLSFVALNGLQAAALPPAPRPFICANDCDGRRPDPSHA